MLAAYRRTVYRVYNSDASIAFSIGIANDALSTLLQDTGVATGALITAWNPFSEPRESSSNLAANERLREDVESRGLAWLPAEGCDPAGLWPCEESLLVLGPSRETALQLCNSYGQNAVVWIGEDAIPVLLLADGSIVT